MFWFILSQNLGIIFNYYYFSFPSFLNPMKNEVLLNLPLKYVQDRSISYLYWYILDQVTYISHLNYWNQLQTGLHTFFLALFLPFLQLHLQFK